MKKFFFIISLLLFVIQAQSRHVAGGELLYEYLGNGTTSGNALYKVTLRLFRDCFSTGPSLQTEQVNVGIYEGLALRYTLNLPLQGTVTTLNLNTSIIPCLVGSVQVCYEFATYSNTIELPINVGGYTLTRAGCCRIEGITNISGNNVGNTFITTIPGTAVLPTGFNSSPKFLVKDTALVCRGKYFELNFGAEDIDGDAMNYSFCSAYTAPNGSNNAAPSSTLDLNPVNYISPFFGTDPLSGVNINQQTGLIAGFAPGIGQYIVSVCITEVRNGVAISEHRKDFILKVQDCDFLEARLPNTIVQCDSFGVRFENQSTSSGVLNYLWNFGDGNFSTQPNPVHTYADTGTYKAFLQVTGANGCVGIDSTDVSVYPGFWPGFTVNGSCFQNPFLFMDTTKTAYGIVNKWRWNFGETSTAADTSIIRNPSYIYPNAGTRKVTLIVSNSKGCEKTVEKDIVVSDKPFLLLPFKDTLICSIDTLPLIAVGTGNFSWLPNTNIVQANTANPLVYPKDSITYYVTLNDNGCVTRDSIKVNVLDFIKVDAGTDTSICRTDFLLLQPTSDALGYVWQASTNEAVAAIKNPTVQPLVATTYYVTANLGKCQNKDSIYIKVAPYPVANAGMDSSICFGTKALLNGSMVASSFVWQPTNQLINVNTLFPIAAPSKNTYYTLTVTDTLGCNKAVTDSVLITVIPKVVVNAGNDTAVVNNQPLQLNVTCNFDNNVSYQWTPSVGLSNTQIPNPISILSATINEVKYTVVATLPQGCKGEDEIVVKVFSTNADFFIPTAFTPNGDGKNETLKPICIGITQLKYFRVYNRWGQLLFETKEMNKGWDGSIKGVEQPNGTYVILAEAIDYTGKLINKKGTVVLIR